MFCPYCGTESTQGLNYCNRCGGNLAPLAQGAAQPETRPAVVVSGGAAWAAGLSTTAMVVMGVGMIFPIATELAARHVAPEVVVLISLLVAGTTFGCAAMLLRFWSMLFGVRAATTNRGASPALPDPRSTDTRELGASRLDSLNPAPAPSITEQTTRTLDHAPKKY